MIKLYSYCYCILSETLEVVFELWYEVSYNHGMSECSYDSRDDLYFVSLVLKEVNIEVF